MGFWRRSRVGRKHRRRVAARRQMRQRSMVLEPLEPRQLLSTYVFDNVPEAANYSLVYELPIGTGNDFRTSVPYAVDNTSQISQPFDRIAYYLELQQGAGPLQWVYVSMDAFTSNANKIGVPNPTSGEFYQQNVANMNVLSNVAGIVTGTGLTGGNIEFWPSNYGAANDKGVPNADAGLLDFGDGGAGTGTGYGSMQIHNHDAAQTLLAFNGWNNATSDLGIGNNTVVNATTGKVEPDWTFRRNAGDYTLKNMAILVRQVSTDTPPALLSNAPELADYQLVYMKNIPNGARYSSQGVGYDVDNSASIPDGTFDRVAYYLQLDNQFVEVSFAAAGFTNKASKIGIPNTGSGEFYQQLVSNMNVTSNVAGVVNGTGITTGNIEFWPSNYNQSNAIGVPGASAVGDNTGFDFGDGGASTGAGHGSMQVHNHGAGQTVFAYNNWNNGGGELGIGNRTGTNVAPDWTFAGNAGSYATKQLYVFVRRTTPPTPITAPSAPAELVANAPELADYRLVYRKDLPTAANYSTGPIAYEVDHTAQVPYNSFDRVAYYLKLDNQFVEVSFNADGFSNSATELGIPNAASGENYQQFLANMNVTSNVSGVVNGAGIATGNIEFWPNNYQGNNSGQNAGLPPALAVPGSSNTGFDFGDRQSSGGHGSMQIHNYGAGQTLFAYNNWNTTGNSALGIGNQPTGEKDWTFNTANIANFTTRQLYVLVRPREVGTSGDDTIVLKRVNGLTQYTVNSDGPVIVSDEAALVINGLAGADTLTIDYSGGNPIPAGGLTFNGGDPTTGSGDRLVIANASGANAITNLTHTYANGHDGQITIDGAAISYTGLEPIDMIGSTVGNLVLNLAAAGDQAILEDDGTAGNGISRIRSLNGSFETTTFANPTASLTVNANGGDTVSIAALDSLFAAPAITVSGTNAANIFSLSAANLLPDAVALTVTGAATFDLAGFNETIGSLSGDGAVALGAGTLTTGGNGGSTTFSGPIGGSGSVTKTGSGTWTLTSTGSTYSGGTTLAEGVIRASASASFGSGELRFDGGTLQFAAPFDVSNHTVTFLAGGATFDTNGNNVPVANGIGNNGPGGFTKTGAGTLYLSGHNTYAGATDIDAGKLQLPPGAGQQPLAVTGWNQDFIWANSEPTAPGGTTYTLNDWVYYEKNASRNGGANGLPSSRTFTSVVNPAVTFQLQPYDALNTLVTTTTASTLTLANPGQIASLNVLSAKGNATVTITYTLNFADGSTTSGNFQPRDWTQANAITTSLARGSDSGGAYYNNAGLSETDIVLSAADQAKVLNSITFTASGGGGSWIMGVSGNILGDPNTDILPDTSPVTIAAGAALDLAGSSETIGALSGVAGSSVALGKGTLTVNSSDGVNPVDSAFSGVISGSGGLAKSGGGALTLGGANTYGGATSIEDGTIQLAGGADRLPTSTAVTLGDAANHSGRLDLNNQSQQIAGLYDLGNGTDNRVIDSADDATLPVLTVHVAVGTDTFGGILGNANANGFTLTKTGAGTLALTNSNTFTGGTNVVAGTLQLAPAVPAGYAAYYSFDAVSGTAVTNEGTLGAAKNATLVNGATVSAGRQGNAMDLTGNQNAQLQIALTGNKGVDLSGGEWTASVWYSDLYMPPATSQWRALLRARSNDAWPVIVQNNGTSLGAIASGGGNGFHAATPTINMTNWVSGWHQLTAVASGGNTRFYLDGVYQGYSDVAAVSDIYCIGGAYDQTGQRFAQKIDDVYLYQRALSADEVLALYTATGGSATNVLADTSPVNLAAGATLDLAGNLETIGALSGAVGSSVMLGGGTLTVNSSDGANPVDSDFSGVISGNGDLVKDGGGTLTLGGVNTYTGSTTIDAGTIRLGASTGTGGVFANVPEAAGYNLVYQLPIPSACNFTSSVPYSVDNSAIIPDGSFSRIGYYLELQQGTNPLQWVYVSFDAAPFATEANMLGVPNATSGIVYHYDAAGLLPGQVRNMNVSSNVPGLVGADRTGVTTGNVEFWPYNYSNGNAYGVPNADAGGNRYDWGDTCAFNSNYGSMQIHDYGLGATLFAFNHWNSGAGNLGIGNRPTGDPDWTFNDNVSGYSIKNLQIVVDAHVSGAIPSQSPVTIAAGATLDMAGYSATIGSLADGSGGGGSVVNSDADSPLTLALSCPSGSTTFSGTIGDDGAANAVSLVKEGAGTQVLAGNNTYHGATNVNNGTLQLGTDDALPAGTELTLGTAATSGLLDLAGYSQTVAGLTASARGATNKVIDSDASVNTNTLTVNLAAGTQTFRGTLGDAADNTFSLAKDGAGTFELAVSATYTGSTAIEQGTLRLVAGIVSDNPKIMPLGDSITYGSGGTNAGYRGPLYSLLSGVGYDFQFVGSTNGNPGTLPTSPVNQTYHEGHGGWRTGDDSNGILHGVRTVADGGLGWLANTPPDVVLLHIGTNNTGSPEPQSIIDVGGILDQIHTQRPTAFTFVAQIVPKVSGGVQLPWVTQYNTDLITLVADKQALGYGVALVDMNTNYPTPWSTTMPDNVHPNGTGYAWMAQQWFDAIIAHAGHGSDVLPVTTPVSIAAGATLDLNGVTQTIASLDDLGGGGGAVVNGDSDTALTLTLNAPGGSTSFRGTIDDGSAANAIGLVKAGSGIQALAGASSYRGGTTVSGGTLLVNNTAGSGTGSGDVAVESGATLGGTGTIAGTIAVETGGTLSPGVSPGKLTANEAVTLAAGATFRVELNGPAAGTEHDQLQANGIDLTGSTLELSRLATFFPGETDTLTIVDNVSGDPVVGEFAGMADESQVVVDGIVFRIDYQGGDGNDVVLSPVPFAVGRLVVDAGWDQPNPDTDKGDDVLRKIGAGLVEQAGLQHSMVTRIVLTLDGVATIDNGAITLARAGTGGGPVSLFVSPVVVGGTTVVTVDFRNDTGSFTYARAFDRALVDGDFKLTIDASKIHNAQGPLGADATDYVFHRFFGDSDGDRDVDATDLNRLRRVLLGDANFASYRHAFDFDGNDVVDGSDYTAFRARYGKKLKPAPGALQQGVILRLVGSSLWRR